MNIEGKVSGIFRDSRTGEVTKVREGTNHIQDRWISDFIGVQNPGSDKKLSSELFISDHDPKRHARSWTKVPTGASYGSDIPEVESPTLHPYQTPNSHIIQVVQRFSSPSEDMPIYTLGLVDTSTLLVDTVAYLESPWVFLSTETLDLYYRIQLTFGDYQNFASEDYQLNAIEALSLATFMYDGSEFPISFEFIARSYQSPLWNYRQLNSLDIPAGNGWPSDSYLMDVSLQTDSDFFKQKVSYSLSTASGKGHLVGAISTPGREKILIDKVLPANESPLQSVFGHNEASTTPFYDSATPSTSVGTLQFDASSWDREGLPSYFRVDITTQGVVGAGKYKFRKCPTLGFDGNTWQSQNLILLFSGNLNSHVSKQPISQYDLEASSELTSNERYLKSLPVPYKDNLIVMVNKTNFTIMDYWKGQSVFDMDNTTLLGSETSPRFLASDISQVAIDDSDNIYIACRDTGIYKIDSSLDSESVGTLTVIDSGNSGLSGVLGAKGVCISSSGRIWTFWDHATQPTLYYSDDGGVSWYNSGMVDPVTSSQPEDVINVFVDSSDPSGKLAILYYSTSPGGTHRLTAIRWWDQTSQTYYQGPNCIYAKKDTVNVSQSPATGIDWNMKFSHAVTCSPDGHWRIKNTYQYPLDTLRWYKAQFGSSTLDDVPLATSDHVGACPGIWISRESDGVYGLFTLSQDGHDANLFVVFNDDTVHQVTCRVYGSPGLTEGYLGDGLWIRDNLNGSFMIAHQLPLNLSDNEFTNHPDLMQEIFPEYGWNGSQWVKGFSGEKTIHAAQEELVDGVTVGFNDNLGMDEFQSTDHFTTIVCNGISDDKYTTFETERGMYFKPSREETDITNASLTLSNHLTGYSPSQNSDFQPSLDISCPSEGNLSFTDGTPITSTFTSGAKSANPVIQVNSSYSSEFPNNCKVRDLGILDAVGWVETRLYRSNSDPMELYFGITESGNLQPTYDPSGIDYAIHVTTVEYGASDGFISVRALCKNLDEKATLTALPFDIYNTLTIGIAIHQDGLVSYWYRYLGNIWKQLYKTTAQDSNGVANTGQDYYLDIASVSYTGTKAENTKYHYVNPLEDYYAFLGNGTDTGLFSNDFYAVDPESTEITIDGSLATPIATNDALTPLNPGEYSLFPFSGAVRLHASDASKPLTAKYITITDS